MKYNNDLMQMKYIFPYNSDSLGFKINMWNTIYIDFSP